MRGPLVFMAGTVFGLSLAGLFALHASLTRAPYPDLPAFVQGGTSDATHPCETPVEASSDTSPATIAGGPASRFRKYETDTEVVVGLLQRGFLGPSDCKGGKRRIMIFDQLGGSPFRLPSSVVVAWEIDSKGDRRFFAWRVPRKIAPAKFAESDSLSP